jgi:hypothetical protein
MRWRAYSLISLTPRPGRTCEDVLVGKSIFVGAPQHTTPINSYNMADVIADVCAPATLLLSRDIERLAAARRSYLTLD